VIAELGAAPAPKAARPRWLDEVVGRATGRGVVVGAFSPGVGRLARGPGFLLEPSGDWEHRIGHGTACAPAVFANVLGVDAAAFSDPWRFAYRPDAAVECAAAGRRWVRWLGGVHQDFEAQSYAAPYVAGLAALVLERAPCAGLDGVREFLARHGREGVERRR